ncbi:hypothetical protein C7S16_2514 [Burkholderia thailandensis]|uniref:Uncharacterized protein n=1 Tax=Burkholderia thailandensis TaxID=57975 RepID=A0AAW9CWN5_BURTH|nr:hypothetical protein [Burkholderia thailandensis]MDW9254286.1 hypothetical protein [Burkholderia thailandensis]
MRLGASRLARGASPAASGGAQRWPEVVGGVGQWARVPKRAASGRSGAGAASAARAARRAHASGRSNGLRVRAGFGTAISSGVLGLMSGDKNGWCAPFIIGRLKGFIQYS